MARIPVKPNDLSVGACLDWPLYDGEGRLLLQKGAVIGSQRQIDDLLERGLFRERGSALEQERSRRPVTDPASAFERLDGLLQRIPDLFRAIIAADQSSRQRLDRLTTELRALYAAHPDHLLGAVHLAHDYSYGLRHPVHVAIVCQLLATALDYEDSTSERLVAAALTANVGMLKLQDTMQKQPEPPSREQREQIRAHPQHAVQLLRAAGLDDADLLDYVLQHHERADGSGYPAGLSGTQIREPAAVLALADRYCALVSAREYRPALPAKQALRELYLNMGSACDEQLTQAFIRQIGIYPPGSFVTLNNGETGIVIHRGREPLRPLVSGYLSPRGTPYPRPFRRDTSVSAYRIQAACAPDLTTPLNLSLIWAC